MVLASASGVVKMLLQEEEEEDVQEVVVRNVLGGLLAAEPAVVAVAAVVVAAVVVAAPHEMEEGKVLKNFDTSHYKQCTHVRTRIPPAFETQSLISHISMHSKHCQ